jgi:hypothetical protein
LASPPRGAKVSVGKDSVGGDGCKDKEYEVWPMPGGKGTSVRLLKFKAERPPNSTKTCSIGIQVIAPKGYTFAMRSFTIRAKIELGAKAKGWLWGGVIQVEQHEEFIKQLYTEANNGEPEIVAKSRKLDFVECGGRTDVSLEMGVELDAPESSGSTAAELINVSVDDFAWRRC